MFFVLFYILYLSQLFIIAPGSDITGARGSVYLITIGGLSYSAILCILLIAYCLISIIFKRRRGLLLNKTDLIGLGAIVGFVTLGLVSSIDIGITTVIDYCLKILTPFILYYYMRCSFDTDKLKQFYSLILLINVMLIAQVLVCKVLTGHFSASSFYWYLMEEEYFGYYNSPHPFTALLGLLSVWNLRCLIKGKMKFVNLGLLLGNIILIMLSGVRTYAVALAVSAGFILFFSLFNKKLKNIRLLAILVIIMGIMFSGVLSTYLATSRFSASMNSVELSSGRIDRWITDLTYYSERYDIFQTLFGGGFSRIYLINSVLIGVSINSLNFIIDLLMDNGIVGMVLLIIAYVTILKWCYTEDRELIFFSIVIYLSIGLFINNLLPYVTVMPLAMIFFVVLKLESEVDQNALLTEEA